MKDSDSTKRLLTTLAHDIRTPLNAMMFTLRLLEAKLGKHMDDEDRADFVSLRSQIWAILDLHNGILDHARLTDGRLIPETSDFSLDDALASCVQVVHPLAAQKGLPLVVDLNAGGIIRSHRSILQHIIGNLLSNAIRYTERGHVAISSRIDEQGVQVKVEDTGVGIAMEDRNRIFDEYFRADSTKDECDGFGLGLAMARQMAVLMGGELSVVSRPGAGSIFTLFLPLQTMASLPSAESTP